MRSRHAICVLALLAVSACSAHSPMILHDTVDSTPTGVKASSPHTNKVFVSEGGLPDGAAYEVIETINVGTIWYGSDGKVDQQMAERARAIGADAVINVKHWKQPSGFSWAAPHGSGQAVKLRNQQALHFDAVPGTWL